VSSSHSLPLGSSPGHRL